MLYCCDIQPLNAANPQEMELYVSMKKNFAVFYVLITEIPRRL
jgi:hypothetical protein